MLYKTQQSNIQIKLHILVVKQNREVTIAVALITSALLRPYIKPPESANKDIITSTKSRSSFYGPSLIMLIQPRTYIVVQLLCRPSHGPPISLQIHQFSKWYDI